MRDRISCSIHSTHAVIELGEQVYVPSRIKDLVFPLLLLAENNWHYLLHFQSRDRDQNDVIARMFHSLSWETFASWGASADGTFHPAGQVSPKTIEETLL